MTELATIVDVEISLSATPVPLASFQNMAFGAAFQTFTDRIRYYGSAAALIVDGFADTDAAYIYAQTAFSQPNPPVEIAIIRKDAGDANWTAALNAVALVDNSWYGLAVADVTAADIELIAAWAQANKKIYFALSADAGIIAAGSGDVASILKGLAYDRTAIMYHAAGLAEPMDAAWLARCLPQQPGSLTYKFKQLIGITPDVLTDTQANNAAGVPGTQGTGKSCNLYQVIGGVPITREGITCNGEFIDNRIFMDYLAADMQNRIYTLLVNNPKVPLTDHGISSVEQAIRASLRNGVAVGGLSPDVPYGVTMPTRASLGGNNLAARALVGATFNATLADAVHSVQIRGTVVP